MDAEELDKFLKICREQGVSEINFEGVSVKFGEMPTRISTADELEDTEDELEDTESDIDLTPEQLMYYHTNAGGPA